MPKQGDNYPLENFFEIKPFIEILLAKIESLPQEDETINLYVKIKSVLDVKKIKAFLSTLIEEEEVPVGVSSENNPANEFSHANLYSSFTHRFWENKSKKTKLKKSNITIFNDCIDFFKQYWDEFLNQFAKQNANFFLGYTKAMRAYLLVSEEMLQFARENNLETNLSSYELLIPPLEKSNINHEKREKLKKLKLHQFIVGDDGLPIEVYTYFYNLIHDGDLKQIFRNNNDFSSQERMRLIVHSGNTQKINNNFGNKINAIQSLEELGEELESDHFSITISPEQCRVIVNCLFDMQQDLISLAEFMNEWLPREYWQDFVNQIGAEKLKQLVLKNDTIDVVAERVNNMKNIPELQRALMFIEANVYLPARKVGDDFDTYTAKTYAFVQSYVPTFFCDKSSLREYKELVENTCNYFNKNEKTEVCDIFIKFLLTDNSFSEFPLFLKERLEKLHREKNIDNVYGSAMQALQRGRLGKIAKHAMLEINQIDTLQMAKAQETVGESSANKGWWPWR